jgi:hypothetical protein
MQGCRFQEWPFLEDVQWVKNMRRLHGRPAILNVDLLVSARRWQHLGIVRTTLINQFVLFGYAIGIPVPTLHQLYNKCRPAYVNHAPR